MRGEGGEGNDGGAGREGGLEIEEAAGGRWTKSQQ